MNIGLTAVASQPEQAEPEESHEPSARDHGKRYEDRQLRDPAGLALELAPAVRDEIKTLVDASIESL